MRQFTRNCNLKGGEPTFYELFTFFLWNLQFFQMFALTFAPNSAPPALLGRATALSNYRLCRDTFCTPCQMAERQIRVRGPFLWIFKKYVLSLFLTRLSRDFTRDLILLDETFRWKHSLRSFVKNKRNQSHNRIKEIIYYLAIILSWNDSGSLLHSGVPRLRESCGALSNISSGEQ